MKRAKEDTPAEKRRKFLAHLERCSRIAAKWPQWKRNLFGWTRRQQRPATRPAN